VGLVETGLAIIPGAGGTQRLSRLTGVSKAKEMIYMASVLKGSEALENGIVNFYCEMNAMEKAVQVANRISENGPIAIKLAKKAIDQGSQVSK
jgi:methylglutaconyl-CoA hydratase